jgi:hypothetical protein
VNAIATLALVLCLGPAAGCGREDTGGGLRERPRPAAGTALIFGTTLDAGTGEPLVGVEVTGPGGARGISDERGKFVLSDIPEGTSGRLLARSRDGREAINTLRPLRNARLEVVMHLRAPRER